MRLLLAATAVLVLGGCGEGRGISDYEGPIHERWTVSENASPECLSAALLTVPCGVPRFPARTTCTNRPGHIVPMTVPRPG